VGVVGGGVGAEAFRAASTAAVTVLHDLVPES